MRPDEGHSTAFPTRPSIVPFAAMFLASACIMSVELVAARLVAPYLGQSVHTWSAVIAVMLGGIAVGNAVGGRLADRYSRRLLLPALFAIAGAACMAALPLNRVCGTAFITTTAWPLRIACHILIAFLPCALGLGTLSPVLTRWALGDRADRGRVMGWMFALSTAGAVSGTFLVGFVLLGYFGLTAIAVTVSGVLWVVGASTLVSQVHLPQRQKPDSDAENGPSPSSATLAGFIAAMAVAQATLMGIEIAAGRLLSRAFGQSLYTWTTTIGVVLAGMSVGAWLGGRMADRHPSNRELAKLLVLGSMASVGVPILLMFWSSGRALALAGWPGGIVLFAAVLVGPASVLLGATAPVIARRALDAGALPGRTVGRVYAAGAVGSVVGTFVTGYWLIAVVGTLRVFVVAGVTLALLALAFSRKSRGGVAWAGICVTLMVVSVLPGTGPQRIAQAFGLRETPPEIATYTAESAYSYIQVRTRLDKPDFREMALDALIHGEIQLDKPLDLVGAYHRVYAAALDEIFPPGQPLHTFTVGGGGYVFPRYLEWTRPGGYAEVAEIDPAVTEAAHVAMALPRDTAIRIAHTDARNRVAELASAARADHELRRFDCVFGDSFSHFIVPPHLTTHEFVMDCADLLKDDGIYMLNAIDLAEAGRFVGAVVATCRSVFPHVYVFGPEAGGEIRTTYVVVSSKRPLDLAGTPLIPTYNSPIHERLLTPDEVDALVERAGGLVLTDDFAPVEQLLAPLARPGTAAY
ncbi:MAG: spermidine synthase [bacterium]|nr:spermidine synthase [bacterium]